jgi:hypothetical protein
MADVPFNPFHRAKRRAMPAKAALVGPAGAGKTIQMLMALEQLAEGGPVAVIDTEHLTSELYADDYQFDVVNLGPLTEHWHPQEYLNKLHSYLDAAEAHGYAAVGLDSFSHAWDAILALVDDYAAKNRGNNSFQAWGAVGTPEQQRMVDKILGLTPHTLVTMRARTDWIMQETVNSKGATVQSPTKVGMGARQREGTDYEFQLIMNIDLLTHRAEVEKSRARLFADRNVTPDKVPGFWREYRDWLASGVDLASPKQLDDLRARLEATKTLGDQEGRRVRDAFRGWLDGRKLDELMRLEAVTGLWVLDDLISGGDGRVPAEGVPPGVEEGGESESAASPVEASTRSEGAAERTPDEQQPVDPMEAPFTPPVTLDPMTPAPEQDDEVSAGSGGPTSLPPEPEDEVSGAPAPAVEQDDGHHGLDPLDADQQLPNGSRTYWLPTVALVRFGTLLACEYGVDAGEITDDVLVHAAQTQYDPTWLSDGAFEKELADAARDCAMAAVDAQQALHPEQPAARELVAVWRQAVPGVQLEPAPPDPEPPTQLVPDDPSHTVDPPARRTRARKAS